MKWITNDFPRLVIHGVAHFHDGVFRSSDPVVIARMAAWEGKYGVARVADDVEPVPQPLDPWPQYLLPAELLDGNGKVPDSRLPDRLSDASLKAA